MLYVAVIKGTYKEAYDTARGYIDHYHHLIDTRAEDEVAFVVEASDECMIEWFCTPPMEAPYEPGSLLFYTTYTGEV